MRRRKPELGFLAVAAAACALCAFAPAQAQSPQVPDQYKPYFAHYVDKRSLIEKTLNLINVGGDDVGRSFALIAGVSDYPNMKGPDRKLSAAAEDLRKLEAYLKQYEFFDEIVVLKNSDVTTENLEFFLQNYFPERLRQFPKSRFLFAYSGHGMTEGSNGYILRNTASRVDDRTQSINVAVIRAWMDDVVRFGHHVLVLINACHSGAFLKRSFGTAPSLPKNPGAHAITSGGTRQLSFADPAIGPGSVFFEKLFSGLDGLADTSPKDGVVTAYELAAYLFEEVQISTRQGQTPQFADLNPNQSRGQFFFLNRERMVQARLVPEWRPGQVKSMGAAAEQLLAKGREAFQQNDFPAALESFEAAANAGNAEAMAWTAHMFHAGYGVRRDPFKAFEWYEKSAQGNYAWGMSMLGEFYRDGIGVEKNPQRALGWLKNAAEAGDADAMAKLGYAYERGSGTEPNPVLACRWYEKSALASSAIGMNNFGWCYEAGQGVKQDYAKAMKWYTDAARAGEPLAMANLGLMHLGGRGVPVNYAKALEWFEKGAVAGNVVAMRNVALMYENGQGVPKSFAQAYVWYEKAAQAGDAFSMGNLGTLYLNGSGVKQDYSAAFTWFEKGAAAGDQWSAAGLGVLYRDGLGVKKDLARSLELIRKAAAEGIGWGMSNLGYAYEEGLGVEKSYPVAMKWYESAARDKQGWAAFRLGWIHENGLGVPPDPATAISWYEKAVALGEKQGAEGISRLKRR